MEPISTGRSLRHRWLRAAVPLGVLLSADTSASARVARSDYARAVPPSAASGRADSLHYGTGTWEPDSLGNHRAVLRVPTAGEAVYARIPWRRRDATPEQVDAIVMNAQSGDRVRNVARVAINREYGDFVFEATTPGTYYVYYMPYTGTFKSNYPKITYRPPMAIADAAWTARHASAESVRAASLRALPAAVVTGFDAVNDFSRFTPMEYIATAAEREALIAKNPNAGYLAFPEDRSRSIRMTHDIPQLWAERGAFTPFTGKAERGESYSFQIGVWAHRGVLDGVGYRASDFVKQGGGRIPASALTAYNLEGVDWSGTRFVRPLHVDAGAVQPLWFGLNVPETAVAGTYNGRITLSAAGQPDREIDVRMTVLPTRAVAHGDDAPRISRDCAGSIHAWPPTMSW